jgi:peptidoglycan-associated lipoprotein
MQASTRWLSLVAVLAVLTACGGRKPQEQPAPEPAPRPAPPSPAPAPRPEPAPPPSPAQPAEDPSAAAARATAAALAELAQPIHFDFDKSDIRPEDRPTLDRKAAILRANSGVRIRIAGHCDERGSDEYNLALGNRRALAAKQYLVNQGIAADRIETISFGEEQPVDPGHNEAAWAKNRRDEFEVTARPAALVLP